MEQNIYKRLAKAEAMTSLQKAQLPEVLKKAYQIACASGDEQTAADAARALRNRLLDLSDREMPLDRLGLDTSSAIAFLASLRQIFSGEWAAYRQALRDIPQQEGFPFNITFPVAPDKTEDEIK